MSLNFDDPSVYTSTSSIENSQSFHFVNNVFDPKSCKLAELYKPWKRCLAIVDQHVDKLYGAQIRAYFKANHIDVTVQPADITEECKSIGTLLIVCGWITDFDILRGEPVLVIGGGLVTDVIGFACAIYRRTTRYIRIPTTLIGLIDASVSNRVAVNWNGLKNRLGAYHEPLHTIIDTTFLKTLPQAEIRNGIAEILKISSCAHLATFEAVEKYGSRFIEQRFGHVDGSREVVAAVGDVVIRQTIRSVLTVEIPNPREHNLNRIMYFGHTWSPVLELSTTPPLLHGHAISIDMCFSAAIAHHLGLLDTAHYEQFLRAFSSLGLALDHPAFTVELMRRATAAAVRTRDGLLRAPVPVRGLGECEILMMVEGEVLEKAFEGHKRVVGGLLRGGLGVEVDVAVRCARVVNGH